MLYQLSYTPPEADAADHIMARRRRCHALYRAALQGRKWPVLRAFRAGGLEAGRNRHSPGNLYNPGAFHNIRLMKLTPNQGTPGARIDDIDLSQPISEAQFATILAALGRYGVLCFPKQALDARALKAFSERFGSLQGSPTGTYCEPGVPEVMLLSNILEDGKPIGLADAGQDWHTDMSYNPVVGFTNVLYAVKVPRRDG